MTTALFKTAQRYIPSGVNSPVRAFRAVGGSPVFIQKGKGAYVWDESGKRYLDFCTSWGPLLFGHAPDGLISVLSREMKKGTSFGTATRKEVELAKEIHRFFPSMEKVRLVNSGTEAVMSAVRLARGFTGRKKILKLDGGYHGHVDSLLVKAGSGAMTFGTPDSAGIPEELAKLTLSIPFNDSESLARVFRNHGEEIAAFILEPVPANMGVVLPQKGFLKQARALTEEYDSLLILDEVITGFRISSGGAQKDYGIKPDLTCLGKILGGGFPLAAFGGRTDVMDFLAPSGPVYQAGTLSGNPVAVSAALWMLREISEPKIKQLNRKAAVFFQKLRKVLDQGPLPVQLNATASMFTLFFTDRPVTDYASAKTSDPARYARFFQNCLQNGLYIAPSQFEANFVSWAHTEKDLDRTITLLKKIL